jgi:hypothetical protein
MTTEILPPINEQLLLNAGDGDDYSMDFGVLPSSSAALKIPVREAVDSLLISCEV